MRPPEIKTSTEEERRQYIKDTFPCIADCDMCGLCTVFRGKDPELAYADYAATDSSIDFLMASLTAFFPAASHLSLSTGYLTSIV